jgi:hypothetical protein
LETNQLKNYLIGALICLVAALTIGIEPVQRFMNEATNRGTLRGVEKCMDYAKSELLSQEAVKASCVQVFHERLYLPDLATGLARPRVDQDKVGWEGTLENNTADHVTTWVKVGVSIFDEDGKEREVFAEIPIWIDPMGETNFQVELPDLKPEELGTYGPCELDDQTPKECISWGITDVMGLAI